MSELQSSPSGPATPAPAHPPAAAPAAAVLALVFNAFVWGVSWWPLRELQQRGLHPLWTTSLVFTLAAAAIAVARPRALAEVWRTPSLWWLVAASGATNAAFNWGVTIGDVVRVVLLFYLMPLWAVLLARLVLHEPVTRGALARVALALAGAATVLWPAPGPEAAGASLAPSMADLLGLAGGFAFALNNVMLRREAARSAGARGMAMFVGGAVVAGVLALALPAAGSAAVPPPGPVLAWAPLALVLAAAFLSSNMALQYGAARLPANVTAVVMLGEVLFASLSSLLLGAGRLDTRTLVGGALIVAAAVLAARRPG